MSRAPLRAAYLLGLAVLSRAYHWDYDCCLTATMMGDPHVKGAHGDRFSIRGEHEGTCMLGGFELGCTTWRTHIPTPRTPLGRQPLVAPPPHPRPIFCADTMLSSPGVQFNAKFKSAVFGTPWSHMNVNGSFARTASWLLRTPVTGRRVQVSFDSSKPHSALIAVENPVQDDLPPIIQNVLAVDSHRLTDQEPYALEGIKISLQRKTLTVETKHWRMIAESTVGYPHWSVLRLNLRVTSLTPVCSLSNAVAPHGILGQTFDCDGIRVDGQEDSYHTLDDGRQTASRTRGGSVTTRAQGEGALEGTARDYLVRGPFDVHFAFSRFNATHPVKPRDAASLAGPKHARRRASTCACSAPGWYHSPGMKAGPVITGKYLSGLCAPNVNVPLPASCNGNFGCREGLEAAVQGVLDSNAAPSSSSANGDCAAITTSPTTGMYTGRRGTSCDPPTGSAPGYILVDSYPCTKSASQTQSLQSWFVETKNCDDVCAEYALACDEEEWARHDHETSTEAGFISVMKSVGVQFASEGTCSTASPVCCPYTGTYGTGNDESQPHTRSNGCFYNPVIRTASQLDCSGRRTWRHGSNPLCWCTTRPSSSPYTQDKVIKKLANGALNCAVESGCEPITTHQQCFAWARQEGIGSNYNVNGHSDSTMPPGCIIYASQNVMFNEDFESTANTWPDVAPICTCPVPAGVR